MQQLLQCWACAPGCHRVAHLVAQAVVSHVLSCRQTQAQARHSERQTIAFGGFQYVVHNALLKGFDGVLVVGGDENDLGQERVVFAFGRGQLGNLLGRFHAREAGHADVKKGNVGAMLLHQGHGLDAVFGFADDVQFWPGLG